MGSDTRRVNRHIRGSAPIICGARRRRGSRLDLMSLETKTSEGQYVDLYEYQARELFEAHGVPVLAGIVASTPQEA